MGSREFEFEEDLVCDICGKKGAYDFYGDYICPECMTSKEKKKNKNVAEVPLIDKEIRTSSICPVCRGGKYMLFNDGLMHPCPSCNGLGV